MAVPKRQTPPDALDRLDRYVHAWLQKKGSRSDRTRETYAEALYRSGPDVLNQPGGVVDQATAVQLYRQWQDRYSIATANLMAAAWSALWEDMIRDGDRSMANPWKGWKRRPPPNRIHQRIMTKEEVHKLILNAKPGMPRTLIRFLYYTGSRISATLALTWADITEAADGVRLATMYDKGGKTRTVRIKPSLWDHLIQLDSFGHADQRIFPTNRTQAWRWIRAAAKRAKIPADRVISPHVLRHSHATHAIESGASLMDVQANLGHARLDTTKIYVNLRPGPRSEAYLDDF